MLISSYLYLSVNRFVYFHENVHEHFLPNVDPEERAEIIQRSIDYWADFYRLNTDPNTEFNEESYKKKHGIKSTNIKLNEIHCSPREQTWLNEYQEIVTETSSMTKKDWQQRNIFSVVLMAFHSFKVGFYFLHYFMNELKMSSKDFLCGNHRNLHQWQ